MSKFAVLMWRKVFEVTDQKRLAKQAQDTSDLHIIRDIKYVDDAEPVKGHLLDIYQLPNLSADAPVIIDIHGGGLFASYKELTCNFNYQWARMGYRVVSLSYRLIPETKLWHQIDDIMVALRFLKKNAEKYKLNLKNCALVGDSAGALLSLFALSINGSKKLQQDFGIQGADIPFRAAGLISIMIDTQRRDVMMAINNVVTDKDDIGKNYLEYLLNPVLLVKDATLPPVFMVTSAEDLIKKDTLKLECIFAENGKKHELLNYPRGKGHILGHVFSVSYPMYTESKQVFEKMDAYFKNQFV